jgi:hypothetical protein
MLMTSGSDLYEKKSVSSRTEEVLKTLVWYGIFNALLLGVVLLFGMDETSLMPHELLIKTPAIALPPILNYTFRFFSLAAYKYVGVSVRNTFANTDGLFFIVLLVLYHFITGNAQYATRLFTPLTIVGVILIFGGFIIYPHIRGPKGAEISRKDSASADASKAILIFGILVSFTSAFFDGAESMVSSVLIGDDIVDSAEYIAANALIQVLITVLIWIYLCLSNKKAYNPFRKTEKNRCISQSFSLLSDLFYVFALSDDALLGIILWNLFPILDIVGARIFLKEKLTIYKFIALSCGAAALLCLSIK